MLYHTGRGLEVGCDEVGRGPLAGPVIAAAIVLPKDFSHDLLDDSKRLTRKQRDILESILLSKALGIGIAEATPAEIDSLNILQATFLAMHRAIALLLRQLKTKPDLLRIDGNRFPPYPGIPHLCCIGGDSRYASIAAASILAKNHRDRAMKQLHTYYPMYGWDSNVGYPTSKHRKAIQQWERSPYHRKTFMTRS